MPRLKGMPTPIPRPARRILALALALAGILAAYLIAAPATRAATTTPVYSGTGWKAWTSNGIYSLSPEPYTIVFADTTARSKLTKYFTGPAAQMATAVGVPVTVTTTIDTTPAGTCPSKHRIVVHYVYRPSGTKGMSLTRACHALADGSAWGGHVLMDSEYWTTTAWFSTNATSNENRRKDAVTHELGHAFGLAHPNRDLDKDGLVENYECVKTSTGLKPVMCSPNRGFPPSTEAGRFSTQFDLPGLRQMLDNYYLRQT